MLRLRQNKLFPTIGLLGLFLLFTIPFFHTGIPKSHDGENHIARIAAYTNAFSDINIPPRWAGSLNYGYGTPLFIFFYPLPSYIASFFHTLSLSFEDSYKTLLILIFLATPIAAYYWLTYFFRTRTAFATAIFAGLAPFQVLNIYVRGDVGEALAYLFVYVYLITFEKTTYIYTGLIYGLIILSHNGVSLMISPVLLAYTLLRLYERKLSYLHSIFIFLIGLGVSSYFWIPALLEQKYKLPSTIGSTYLEHFPTLTQLLWSPWGWGSDVAKSGGLSPQLGPIHLLLTFIGMTLALKNKKRIAFWIVVFVCSIYISLPISKSLWDTTPLLPTYQFPWRFIGMATIAMTLLIGLTLEKCRAWVLSILVLTLLITTVPKIHVPEYLHNSDEFYKTFPGTTYYHGEAMTMWTAGDPGVYPKQKIETISGDATVTNIVLRNQIITFNTNATIPSQILINTHYFPGWRVYVNNMKIPVEFQDTHHRGLLTFHLPSGISRVRVQFHETPLRLTADCITLVTLSIILICLVRKKIT